jgi:hypothetical protein
VRTSIDLLLRSRPFRLPSSRKPERIALLSFDPVGSGRVVAVGGFGPDEGWQRSSSRSMAAVSSLTLMMLPRRMAWRVMIEKKISTMFSHDPEGSWGEMRWGCSAA